MRKPKLLLTLTLMLGTTFSQVQATPKASSTHETIAQTALNYFHATANGDMELLSDAFDTEYGDVKILDTDAETGKKSIRRIPFDKFIYAFKDNKNKPWQADVLSVDVVDEQMAMVKLSFKTEKSHYIDYLVMYKRDQKWRIVNKTFVNIKK